MRYDIITDNVKQFYCHKNKIFITVKLHSASMKQKLGCEQASVTLNRLLTSQWNQSNDGSQCTTGILQHIMSQTDLMYYMKQCVHCTQKACPGGADIWSPSDLCYLRQWNEVNWRKLWDWLFCPCVCVCLSTRIGKAMHSNECLLVWL